MAKEKYTSITTPIGGAYFAHFFETEKFVKDGKEKDTGKYSVLLKLKDEDSDNLKAIIINEWDKFKDTLDKKVNDEVASIGLKEYKDEEYFKFTMNAAIPLKNGKVLERTLPLYDAKGHIITNQITEVGNGSKIKVSADLVPFYMSKNTYGISLRLKGVQIITLEDNVAPSAASLGFGVVEEGLDITEEQQQDDEPMFDNAEEEAEVEGDF